LALIYSELHHQYFQEDNELISKKVKRLLQSAIHPILCIGETSEEREAGEEQSVVGNQLAEGLKDIALDDLRRCIVAYEPVWAIGTGKTATLIKPMRCINSSGDN